MRRRESGSTLIWALVAFIVVGGVVIAGTQTLRATSRQVEITFRTEAQALDVARAGIIDAFAWFRRQTSQPVATFAPSLDLSASPPINETDDPSIGLVRDFEISPGYRARYEVRRYVDLDANGAIDPGEGVADLTDLRQLSGAGVVWKVESRGFVYRQIDSSVAWDQDPNYRVAGAIASSEIRQLAVVPPGEAAICCNTGSGVTTGSKSRLIATGATAIVHAETTGTPNTSGAEIAADQTSAGIPDYDASWNAVFGATPGELREMATLRLEAGASIPSPLPDLAFVFAEGDITVTSAAPLQGTGLIVVDGDLTLEAGNNSYFTGIIYVTGNYVQRAPSLVRGTVIVLGTAEVRGSGDIAELVFEADVTNLINGEIGPYRLSRGLRRLDTSAVGGATQAQVAE